MKTDWKKVIFWMRIISVFIALIQAIAGGIEVFIGKANPDVLLPEGIIIFICLWINAIGALLQLYIGRKRSMMNY